MTRGGWVLLRRLGGADGASATARRRPRSHGGGSAGSQWASARKHAAVAVVEALDAAPLVVGFGELGGGCVLGRSGRRLWRAAVLSARRCRSPDT